MNPRLDIQLRYLNQSLTRLLVNDEKNSDDTLDKDYTFYRICTITTAVTGVRGIFAALLTGGYLASANEINQIGLQLIEKADALRLALANKFNDTLSLEQSHTAVWHLFDIALKRLILTCENKYTPELYKSLKDNLYKTLLECCHAVEGQDDVANSVSYLRDWKSKFEQYMEEYENNFFIPYSKKIQETVKKEQVVNQTSTSSSSTVSIASQLNTTASLHSEASRKAFQTHLHFQFYKITHIPLPFMDTLNLNNITHYLGFDCDETLFDSNKGRLLHKFEHANFFKNLPMNCLVDVITARPPGQADIDQIKRICKKIEKVAGRKIFASIYFADTCKSKEFVLEHVRDTHVPHLSRDKMILLDDREYYTYQCKLAGFKAITVANNNTKHIDELKQFVGIQPQQAVTQTAMNSVTTPPPRYTIRIL